MRRDHRRQRGGGVGRLPAERGLLHLSDHAVLADGRAGGRVVEPGAANVWGTVPAVVEMQSEGGAAGALHGALQGGALGTTFTASQGLLLMIPNMYKIAGELTAAVLHVAARSLAAQGLSIFGDHSDVMAVRQTGLRCWPRRRCRRPTTWRWWRTRRRCATRVPFVHFFDGFRTSHELNTVETLSDEDLRALVSEELVRAHRGASAVPGAPVHPRHRPEPGRLLPGARDGQPVLRARAGRRAGRDGRARRAHRPALRPGRLQRASRGRAGAGGDGLGRGDRPRDGRVPAGAGRAGRRRRRSGCTGRSRRRRWRRRCRPASGAWRCSIAPRSRARSASRCFSTCSRRSAEAHADGERELMPRVIGGRYGLSSKEFSPGDGRRRARGAGPRASQAPVHDRDQRRRLRHQPALRPALDIEPPETLRAVFFGLGSDGTVGANKNTIKILGVEAGLHAQGYFVYDSKKSGSQTVSHLRFGPAPISAPYLIAQASFVGCHQFGMLERDEVLERAAPGATLLLNSHHSPDAGLGCARRGWCRSGSWPSGSRCTWSTRGGSPVTPAWRAAPTPCCRRASLPSPGCSSPTGRSRRSRRRSRNLRPPRSGGGQAQPVGGRQRA